MFIVPNPSINPNPQFPSRVHATSINLGTVDHNSSYNSYMCNKNTTYYHNIIDNTSKREREITIARTAPGGSLPAVRRIIRKPRNWVQPHVPPGGSSCVARWFLENSRKMQTEPGFKVFTIQT